MVRVAVLMTAPAAAFAGCVAHPAVRPPNQGRLSAMHAPRVTVAIPLFNTERYIGQALASVIAQSFADFEVVVVDDGSTDDSASIVHGYRDQRIRYARQVNGGPSMARNTALHMARSPLVAFVLALDREMAQSLEVEVEAETAGAITRQGHVAPFGHGRHTLRLPVAASELPFVAFRVDGACRVRAARLTGTPA